MLRLVIHLGAVALLALAIVAGEGIGALAYATRDPAPKPLTSDRIETASRPAIMLIQSDFAASVTVPDILIPDDKYNQIVNKIQAMWNAGQLSSNAQAERAAVNLVVSNPGAYFGRGQDESVEIDYGSTGSGFFVTDDGYFVTAAHVVTSSKADARDQTISTYQDPQYAAQDRADLAKLLLGQLGLGSSGISVTAAQQDKLETFWQAWVAKYVTVDRVDATFRVASGTVQTGDHLDKTGVNATVVSIDPTDTGHDVAIMKADVHDVPTLSIEARAPRIDDATYAIGYPSLDTSPDAVISESMTTGHIQTTDTSAGWTAYGTTALFTEGASGGPVMDSAGRVLGIVSYSQVDKNDNQLYGRGFFIPNEYINQDLAAAGVRTAPSSTDLTSTYYHALADGDIHHYKAELVLLRSIAARSSFDAYIAKDVEDAKQQIAAGKDRTPPDLAPYVALESAGATGAIVLTMVVWLVLGVSAPRGPVGL